MAPETTGQQDLGTYLRIFWRWKLLFAVFVVLIPVGAYVYEHGKPKVYESSTLLATQDVSVQPGGVSVTPSGNLAAVAALVTTSPVINTAAHLLNQPPGSLSGEVSANPDTNTGFLTISAQDRSPVRAAAVANAFAAALANRREAQATNQIDQQVRGLQAQLRGTPRSDASARVTLSQQIAQLQALSTSAISSGRVLQAATPSGTPVSPKTRRAVELALVIALLLGAGAVLIAENTDRRLRTPEDVETLTNWPLLATIPPSAFSPDRLEDPADEQAFEMLRGALTYFNVERQLGSVAIISPLVGDGKTTVAVGLAVATARAGKRAILVDADLRRPQVTARLGLETTPGLGAVLAGQCSLAEALVEYPIDTPEARPLLVLPAGRPPPNPAALLSSQPMRNIVGELERQADLVIIDSVAALAVSDSLPLVRAVSGCVMIVRMNHSSRASVRRLEKIIGAAQGTVLGAVTTGSGPTAAGYAAYHYTENGHQGGALGLLHLRRARSRVSAKAASSNGSATHVAPKQPTE